MGKSCAGIRVGSGVWGWVVEVLGGAAYPCGMSRFWRCAVMVWLLLVCGAARGQVALYANFEANDLTQTSTFVTGGTFGLYDDAYHLGPVHLGADLRGSVLSSGSTGLSKALAGVRVAVKPPLLPIKPYVQLSGGFARLTTSSVNTDWKPAYELNGGVDLTVLPHIDWRMFEVGAGQASGIPDSEFHIATGVVLRFF